MKTIKILHGSPVSFLVTLKNSGREVNLSDGTWEVLPAIRYQTSAGSSPFTLTAIPNGSRVIISMTAEQTALLNRNSPYVILIKCISNTGTTILTKINAFVIVE